MKLKFLRTVPVAAGNKVYRKDQVCEVEDRHAAEVYVAHGYATAVEGSEVTGSTLGARGKHPTTNIEDPEKIQ